VAGDGTLRSVRRVHLEHNALAVLGVGGEHLTQGPHRRDDHRNSVQPGPGLDASSVPPNWKRCRHPPTIMPAVGDNWFQNPRIGHSETAERQLYPKSQLPPTPSPTHLDGLIRGQTTPLEG